MPRVCSADAHATAYLYHNRYTAVHFRNYHPSQPLNDYYHHSRTRMDTDLRVLFFYGTLPKWAFAMHSPYQLARCVGDDGHLRDASAVRFSGEGRGLQSRDFSLRNFNITS